MAFELLKTDYVDAVFEGLRRYLMSENEDGTVSFHDVTKYTVKEGSFFGAKDVNKINTAVNAIMAAVENGTDLYEVFSVFFDNQKELFVSTSDKYNADYLAYLTQLKENADTKYEQIEEDYAASVANFQDKQELTWNTWFDVIKGKLSEDQAGKLQLQIDELKAQMGNVSTVLDNISKISNGSEETSETEEGVETE